MQALPTDTRFGEINHFNNGDYRDHKYFRICILKSFKQKKKEKRKKKKLNQKDAWPEVIHLGESTS